ncbi:MAG: hypothetical protein JNK85_21845 [Verrucomicrobiales bacterium]|nr:hypothetical protein [Verrucomicrobiales bacterium]
MYGLNRFLRGASVLAGAMVLMAATGCASRITNLTPSALPREPSGLYHFEVEWTSTQRSRELRPDTIKGFVVIDEKFYPMERVSKMKDRWEAEVPVSEAQNTVFYHYKWEYGTAGFGRVVPNSIRSPVHRLEIVGASQ